jgi:hypothetical protein
MGLVLVGGQCMQQRWWVSPWSSRRGDGKRGQVRGEGSGGGNLKFGHSRLRPSLLLGRVMQGCSVLVSMAPSHRSMRPLLTFPSCEQS